MKIVCSTSCDGCCAALLSNELSALAAVKRSSRGAIEGCAEDLSLCEKRSSSPTGSMLNIIACLMVDVLTELIEQALFGEQ